MNWHNAGNAVGVWLGCGLEIFIFSTAPRQALGLTELLIHWVPVVPSPGVERLARHCSTAHFSLMLRLRISPLSHMPSVVRYSIKHMDFFIFFPYLLQHKWPPQRAMRKVAHNLQAVEFCIPQTSSLFRTLFNLYSLILINSLNILCTCS